jgi:hypothetical protein
MRVGCAEENVRRTCWQGWRELAAAEVNLKRILDDDVNGATSRCADILTFLVGYRKDIPRDETERVMRRPSSTNRCVFVRVS